MKETKMKRVPKLRFPEFTDDWEQRKLGDTIPVVTDYVAAGSFADIAANVDYKSEPDYAQLVRTVDLKHNFENNDSVYVDKNAFDYLYRVNLDEESIVLPNIGANIGEVYYIESSELPYERNVLGPNAIYLKPNKNTKFIYSLFQTVDFQKKLAISVASSGQPKFNKTELKEILLMLPNNDEQRAIGSYFRNLDNLITLHQRKLKNLNVLKKSVMQKLFSQEVRFKVDDGSEFPDWEEKKLGDDVQFINGRAYKQDELLNSGKYLVLRVGNLFTNDSYYYSDLELDNDKYIENGDLIYAWSATFGPRIYYGEKCIYHYHIWKLKFDENIISKIFLNYYLLYDVEKIKSQRTGGTMVHITKNAMEHRELQFPCLAEQQKIADCLSSLDDVIEKQKATLAAWEELKKGLLQQMFV